MLAGRAQHACAAPAAAVPLSPRLNLSPSKMPSEIYGAQHLLRLFGEPNERVHVKVFTQSINQSINHSLNQSITHSINQSINQSFTQSSGSRVSAASAEALC